MRLTPTILGLAGFAAASAAAQDAPPPHVTKAQINHSPCTMQDFPKRVIYGDTHLHTSYGADAGKVGCTLGHEEAYHFARGETVTLWVVSAENVA